MSDITFRMLAKEKSESGKEDLVEFIAYGDTFSEVSENISRVMDVEAAANDTVELEIVATRTNIKDK